MPPCVLAAFEDRHVGHEADRVEDRREGHVGGARLGRVHPRAGGGDLVCANEGVDLLPLPPAGVDWGGGKEGSVRSRGGEGKRKCVRYLWKEVDESQ